MCFVRNLSHSGRPTSYFPAPIILLPASPLGPVVKLDEDESHLVSGLVGDSLPLQVLGGVKVTLLNSKSTVLRGGHGEKSEVDQVQAKVDPGDGHQSLVETETAGNVPDDTGGAVVRGIVSLDGKGDGDTCRHEEQDERRVSQRQCERSQEWSKAYRGSKG